MPVRRRDLHHVRRDVTSELLAHLAPGAYRYTAMTDDRLATEPVGVTIAAGARLGIGPIAMAPPATLVVSASRTPIGLAGS